mgnify:CR=1 FL=1
MTDTGRRLRVVTWNIHSCIDHRGRYTPERTARVLRLLDPDVVALQEANLATEPSDDRLLRALAPFLPHWLFAPTHERGCLHRPGEGFRRRAVERGHHLHTEEGAHGFPAQHQLIRGPFRARADEGKEHGREDRAPGNANNSAISRNHRRQSSPLQRPGCPACPGRL